MKPPDPLGTWIDLNHYLLGCDQRRCEDLIRRELAGKSRLTFLLRIHSRLNKVRADKERADLRRAK